jgi:23S rRNA (adenine2503-C2)-methyltransferase
MPGSETRINLLDLNLVRMRDFFVSIGEKPFRAEQVLKWIYHGGVTEFDQMSNLSLALRQRLPQLAVIEPPRILRERNRWMERSSG